MLILKKMFKQLDADVMRGMCKAHGRVQIALRYRADTQQLIVKLQCARDLAVMDVQKQSSDPYVTFQLLPDNHDQGEQSFENSIIKLEFRLKT